jgi:hypothetical protein
MVGCEGGRDSKNIGLRILNPSLDLFPTHSKMIITAIKLERTSIIKGIEVFKVRQHRRNGNRPPLLCLAVENLNFMAVCLE